MSQHQRLLSSGPGPRWMTDVSGGDDGLASLDRASRGSLRRRGAIKMRDADTGRVVPGCFKYGHSGSE